MSRSRVACCITGVLAANLGYAAQASKQNPPLAAAGAVQVGMAELDHLVGNKLMRLRTEEYQIKRKVLDEHLAKLLLEREAAGRKLSFDELMRIEVDAEIRPVTDEEVQAVYESAKDRFAGQSEEEARKQIGEGMRRSRTTQRRAEYVKDLKARAGVKILLEPPRLGVEEGDAPAKGPAPAPVTIVEYSDFQCPYCARMGPVLKRIEEKYKDQVRFVFSDYPLPIHKEAPKAAEAAHCARDQGKFWEMRDALFANQKALGVADLKRHAAKLGLEAAAFDQCLDAGRHEPTWRASMKKGESYGVGSTPTLFVNGRVVGGAIPFDVLDEIVSEELARAKERGKTHPASVGSK